MAEKCGFCRLVFAPSASAFGIVFRRSRSTLDSEVKHVVTWYARRSPWRAKAAQRVGRKIHRVCSGSRVGCIDALLITRGLPCRASVRRLHVRHSDGLVPCRAFHYRDARMRLRACADARRDQRSRLQPITRLRQATAWQADHRSLEMFAPAKISTGEAAESAEALVSAETWAWVSA